MYAGLHAKLLREIRADGVEAGSSFSPRPPRCLLRLCHMFPRDGLGFFFSTSCCATCLTGLTCWLLPGYMLLPNEILISEQVVTS